MGPISRALLTLYSLITGLLALLLMAVFGLKFLLPLNFLFSAIHNYQQRMALTVLSTIFLILSALFFFISIKGKKSDGEAVVHETALGQVRISLEAIENLVRKITSQIRGVREVRPRVVYLPEGVAIGIKVLVTPDVIIPDVANLIQQQVKDYVTEVAGTNVTDVKVLVENITTDLRPRVE